MSSRALKKLQSNSQEILDKVEQPNYDSDIIDDISDKSSEPTKKPLNRFDLLNQQSLSESEVKEDDNDTECYSTALNPPNKFSKKKKRRRKKKNTKQSQISSEDNEINDTYLSEIDSYIDKAQRTAHNTAVSGAGAAGQKCETYKSLLSVDYKNLNPNFEMRRTFGRKIVKIEKQSRSKLLKSTHMVTKKIGWPKVTKDIIIMKAVKSPLADDVDGQWFAYEHTTMYRNVQRAFLSSVHSDSDFLVQIIKTCPYHVDSLILLSELCKMTDNYSMASELMERAVLVLETSVHSNFSLITGRSRLDYRIQENRALFIVLFKYAQFLESRACCRTAFEISKLILSFNPDNDPMGIVLIIDYYAIRCKKYAWLIKFYDEWEAIKNLAQLPNMAYSYALVQFHMSAGDNTEDADKSLQYALLMFPGVLKLLLDELSVQTDQRITASSYFKSEVSGNQSPALHQLCSLYVCRAKVIWRDSNILPWLEKNVHIVLDRIDAKDEVIEDYGQKRQQRYVNPPRDILRHIFLSDLKEKVPLAQFVANEAEPIMMHDPLPPLNSINSYERKSESSSPSTSSNTRPVSMFFQSMLPNFSLHHNSRTNIPFEQILLAEEANEARGGPVEERTEHYPELRSSLTTIVDAMREFLSNIRLSQSVHGEENDSSEDLSDT